MVSSPCLQTYTDKMYHPLTALFQSSVHSRWNMTYSVLPSNHVTISVTVFACCLNGSLHFFSEHILVRTSLPRCLCKIDACPPPLCLLLPSYQTYLRCLSPIFVLAFLCFFSRLPFLALLSSLDHDRGE